MNECSDVLLITSLACQLADCLSDDELALLSANLMLMADAIASILAKRELCANKMNQA